MDQHAPQTDHLDRCSGCGPHLGRDPSCVCDQTTVVGDTQVSGLLPPGDTQVVGPERIRFVVFDLCVVIGAERRKVDEVHRSKVAHLADTG